MEKTQREYQKAVSYILEQIKLGQLTIGSRLPTERALAEQLGISRNSTREALRALENTGILESRHGSGNYISGNIADTISQLIHIMVLLNKTNFEEIRLFRIYMEKAICAAAIDSENISDEWKDKVRTCLLGFNGSLDERIAADRSFHQYLVEATGNRLWIELMASTISIQNSSIERVLRSFDNEHLSKTYQIHSEIFDAICSGDKPRCDKAIDYHYLLSTDLQKQC